MKKSQESADDPYRILLQQLTSGSKPEKPRTKTPGNLWRRSHRAEIEHEVNQQAMAAGIPKNKFAPLREKIASRLYSEVGEAEKRHWAQLAQLEYDAAMEKWNEKMNGSLSSSTEPADVQRCIQGLTEFIQPILDGICNATGWKATFIAGGPEPARDGKLNILSIHSGRTKGDVGRNFGEQDAYQKQVLPVFRNFLRKCYTPEECRALALRPEDGFEYIMNLPGSCGPGGSSTVDDPVTLSTGAVPIESFTRASAPSPIELSDSPSPVRHTLQPQLCRPSISNVETTLPLSNPAPNRQRMCSAVVQSVPRQPPLGSSSTTTRMPSAEKTPDSDDVPPFKPRKRLPSTVFAFDDGDDDEEFREARSGGKRLRRKAPEPKALHSSFQKTYRE